jgi:hypothetical protein
MNVIGRGMMKKENHSLTNFSLIIFLVFVIITAFTESCTKVNEFTIGDNFVESSTHLIQVDTFRVDLSTYLLDSVRTSNQSVAYAGTYRDVECGAMSSKSYFTIAYQPFTPLETSAVYDSAAFVFTYSGFYAGDTTSLVTLGIHRITQDIEHFYNDNYFYNNTSFRYQPETLGTIRFYPAPNSSDTTVSVPVNGLGEEIFNLIENNDQVISSSDWFTDYFKGFVLTSEDVNNNMLLGFKADEKHILLKIYYHLNLEAPVEKELSIAMGNNADQFNQIDFDFSNSSLEKIKTGGDEISASDAGGIAVMQGLTGLLPLVHFPSVQDFLLKNRQKVLKAELVFEPVKKSYETFALPEKLYLYNTDKYENLNSQLKNANGDVVIATFSADYMYNDITYTMDITDYVIEELADGYFDYNHGLFIGLSQDELGSTPNRLIIEAKDPRVKLRLFYITY